MASTQQIAKVLQPFSAFAGSFASASRSLMQKNASARTMNSMIWPSIRAEAEIPVTCGRGDKKTKRGKRFKGTFGNARPRRDKRFARFKEKIEVPPSTPWPLPFKII